MYGLMSGGGVSLKYKECFASWHFDGTTAGFLENVERGFVASSFNYKFTGDYLNTLYSAGYITVKALKSGYYMVGNMTTDGKNNLFNGTKLHFNAEETIVNYYYTTDKYVIAL